MFEKFVTKHPVFKDLDYELQVKKVELSRKNDVITTMDLQIKQALDLNQKFLKELTEMREENKVLRARIEQIELEKKNPRHLIESIMGKNIEWFNYQELAPDEKFQYFQEAQTILNSRVFLNETNYLVSCWAQWALKNAVDFEGVRDMRMSVSALQLLKERFEEIEHPGLNISREEIFDAI